MIRFGSVRLVRPKNVFRFGSVRFGESPVRSITNTNKPIISDEACGPYGHDIHFQEICAAWKKAPPVTEMSSADFAAWKTVEQELKDLKRRKEEADLRAFRAGSKRKPKMKRTIK